MPQLFAITINFWYQVSYSDVINIQAVAAVSMLLIIITEFITAM